MDKKIERTVAGVDSLIDSTRGVVVGAADRAERGVGSVAEKVAEKTLVANEYVRNGAEKVADKSSVASEYVLAGAEKVAEKASVASEYVRAGAECGSRAASEKLHAAADAIDRGYTRAAGAIDRGYTRAKSDITRAAEATTDYVAQNSGKAVLVAASAGFLIGFLATRRRVPAAI